MELQDSVALLQKIADYRKAHKILRAAAIGGISSGVLALIMGLRSTQA